MDDEKPSLPRRIELASTGDAARILDRALGRWKATKVLAEVAAEQLRGRPFSHLPPAVDLRETLSRRQCAPAILAYLALRRRLDEEQALELTRELVLAGTIRFLEYAIGPLDRDELLALDAPTREAKIRRLGDRFFNATIRWDEISAKRIRMTVTHCLFPRLCRLGGAPAVAPLLCQGDAVYFGEVLGTIELNRSHTQAEGGAECPFDLRWRQR